MCVFSCASFHVCVFVCVYLRMWMCVCYVCTCILHVCAGVLCVLVCEWMCANVCVLMLAYLYIYDVTCTCISPNGKKSEHYLETISMYEVLNSPTFSNLLYMFLQMNRQQLLLKISCQSLSCMVLKLRWQVRFYFKSLEWYCRIIYPICIPCLKVIRLGHPARLVESVQKFSLDALLSESDSTRIVEDVRKDLEKAMVRYVRIM